MALTKDYGLGEFTFPRGWFMVAEASVDPEQNHCLELGACADKRWPVLADDQGVLHHCPQLAGL